MEFHDGKLIQNCVTKVDKVSKMSSPPPFLSAFGYFFRNRVSKALRKYWKTHRIDLNSEFGMESSWHKIEVRSQ
jgi:hypothetical protein